MQNFKVGDWVKILTFRNHVPVTIKNIEGYRYVLSTGLYADGSILEHWKPKPGEWCWVGYKLMKFSKLIKEDYSIIFEFISPDRNADGYKIKEYILERHLQVVEPFIGELPTYLKDNT